MSYFKIEPAFRPHDTGQLSCKPADKLQTVGAAVQRRPGLEQPHARLEVLDLPRRYVGRITHDTVEPLPASNEPRPVAADKTDRSAAIDPGYRQSLPGNVGGRQ